MTLPLSVALSMADLRSASIHLWRLDFLPRLQMPTPRRTLVALSGSSGFTERALSPPAEG